MQNFIVPGLEIEGKDMIVPTGTQSERPEYREGLFWGNKELGIGQIAIGGRWINVGGLTLADEIIASRTVEVNLRYPVNCRTAAVTVTLPDDVPVGSQVSFFDTGNSWDINTLTITSNALLNDESVDIELITAGGGANLIFLGPAKGWFMIGSTGGGSGSSSGGGVGIPTFVSRTFNADHNKAYFVDLSVGEAVCRLPEFKVGKWVAINDLKGDCSELNPITIKADDKIHGKNEDVILDRKNVSVVMQCVSEAEGWKIISGVGLELVEVTGEGIATDFQQTSVDSFGNIAFIEGLQVTKEATDTYKVDTGYAYIGGLRANLFEAHVQTVTSYPTNLYVEVYREGATLAAWTNVVNITVSDSEKVNYVNDQGMTCYVAKLATINADGTITDHKDKHTGIFERAGNAATDAEIDQVSTVDRHVKLPQLWRAINKAVGGLDGEAQDTYLPKLATAANSEKLGGIAAARYVRLDENNKMTASFLWEGGQDFVGMYWGEYNPDEEGHAGLNAYVRQGKVAGSLEIGSSDDISFRDTDTNALGIHISTKDKTLDAKGHLAEGGISLTNKYLGIDNKAKDSFKLEGHGESYFAKATQVQTDVPMNAKFTDTWRPVSSTMTAPSNDVSASTELVNNVYNTLNKPVTSSIATDREDVLASAKAVKTTYDKALSILENISDSISSTSATVFASSKAVKIAYDKAVAATRYVSDSVTSTSSTNVASSLAVKTAYDKANRAVSDSINLASSVTLASAKAVKTVYDRIEALSRNVSDSVISTSRTTFASSYAVKTAYDKAVAAKTTLSNSVTSSSPSIAASSYAVKAAYDKAVAAKVPLTNSVTSTSTSHAATANAVKQAYDKAKASAGATLSFTSLYSSSGKDNGTITLSQNFLNFDYLVTVGGPDNKDHIIVHTIPTQALRYGYWISDDPGRFVLFNDSGSYWLADHNGTYKTLTDDGENSVVFRIFGLNLT